MLPARPTILILENSTYVTGALKSIVRTSYDLREEFEFVFVIPTGSRARAWIEGKGFNRIHELPFLEISRRPRDILRYVPRLLVNAYRLRSIIKSEGVSLVHSNDLYNLTAVLLKMAGARFAYVCHIRFLPDKFPPAIFNTWLALQLRHAGAVVAVSAFLRQRLADNDRIIVIHNELPVEERYPGGLAQHPAPTLLYLSNLIPGKGQDVALEAFIRLRDRFAGWHLRFVGSDMGLPGNAAFRDRLAARVAAEGLESRVTFHGFTEDVEKEYRMATIALNFSESESFSITCLEALFFGCPLIATDSGGPGEIIDDGETGLLVPVGNIHAITEALATLMGDGEMRQRFAAAGRARVRSRFKVDNTSYRLKEQYLRTLQR